jgi:hypothetical protein
VFIADPTSSWWGGVIELDVPLTTIADLRMT